MRTVGKYFGILLVAGSFIGTLFFRHYTGKMIPYPFLWYLAFVVIGLSGLLLAYRSTAVDNAAAADAYLQALAKIKASYRRVELDFDKCVFKSGSYVQLVEDTELSVLKLALPHSLSLYMDTAKMETRQQSYLIYTESNAGVQQRFISYSFPLDRTSLEYYVITKKLALYVDRFDKLKYHFDLDR